MGEKKWAIKEAIITCTVFLYYRCWRYLSCGGKLRNVFISFGPRKVTMEKKVRRKQKSYNKFSVFKSDFWLEKFLVGRMLCGGYFIFNRRDFSYGRRGVYLVLTAVT